MPKEMSEVRHDPRHRLFSAQRRFLTLVDSQVTFRDMEKHLLSVHSKQELKRLKLQPDSSPLDLSEPLRVSFVVDGMSV